MQSRLILIMAAAIGWQALGCAATFAEPPSESTCATSSRVTVETTTYRFDDTGEVTGVDKRSYPVTGDEAGAPADELLDKLADDEVECRRHETVHHRRITDETTVVDDSPPPDEQAPPDVDGQDAEDEPTTQPAAQVSWLQAMVRALLDLLGATT